MELWEARLFADRWQHGISRFPWPHPLKGVLYCAQGGLCGICGQPLDERGPYDIGRGYQPPNVEHVWPMGLGGYKGLGNIVVAHPRCNRHKGGRLPTGCEIIVLVAVSARLAVPVQLKPGLRF